MKGYDQYIQDVKSGKVKTCQYVKQVVDRFCEFREREDIYFDADCVDEFINFVAQMKHWAGKSSGKCFELLNWQQFYFAVIIGLKWKETGLRVVREVYTEMARKQGKSSIIAALALWHLIGDGEAAPFVACLASTREQSRLIFEMCQNYAKSLDPKGQYLKYYRNYIKMPANNGEVKIFSSDASKLDGLSVSLGIVDEYAVQPDNQLYSKIKTSMGFREQPLMVLITTPQGDLNNPAYDTYKTSIEILAGVKTDDTFWPFIYTLDADEEDQWDNEELWIKSNPSLGTTVTEDFLKSECLAAKNDTSKQVAFKTLNAGIWCQSHTIWIEQPIIASCMKKIDVKDFEGWTCTIGMDLGSVSDFTSFTALWYKNDKYWFKTWTFLPEATLPEHPDKLLYERFIQEGSMIVTPGNCTDYNFICAKIGELSTICPIDTIYTDAWNATSTMITLGNMGFNVMPFSQSIGHFNAPTKSMEKHIRDGEAIIDKSQNVLWQFGNAELTMDHNGNCKVTKGTGIGGSKGSGSGRQRKKVDSVISMCTALGGLEEKGVVTDFTIFSLD